jgi:hypothetical protein
VRAIKGLQAIQARFLPTDDNRRVGPPRRPALRSRLNPGMDNAVDPIDLPAKTKRI